MRGRLTPRLIRFYLQEGLWVMLPGKPPDPPPEWKQWKRDRLAVCIRHAHPFLQGRATVAQIAERLGGVTVQRAAQYVAKGCDFLVQRRFVKEAKSA